MGMRIELRGGAGGGVGAVTYYMAMSALGCDGLIPVPKKQPSSIHKFEDQWAVVVRYATNYFAHNPTHTLHTNYTWVLSMFDAVMSTRQPTRSQYLQDDDDDDDDGEAIYRSGRRDACLDRCVI